MYYSSGNYEAFARPLKPEGIEHKSAYFVGTGLAALSAGCFLVRDAQMPGKNIHFFDRDPIAGGACDGWNYPEIGYVMRGGREMDNHFEVMWDLFRSIPSIETEGVSVLDEYYWLNKADPNYSLCRVTEKRGQNAHTDGKFCLSDKAALQLTHLIFTPDEDLEGERITDVLDAEVLDSNFWTYWRTMFAFYDCNSALEMKRYMQRFIHHIDGLPDLRALRFTKYNQYESMILPMVKYLESHGAQFHFNTQVMDVRFDIHDGRKVAKRVELLVDGRQEFLDLTESDYLFITNGSNVENSSIGGQDKTCEYIKEIRPGGSFDLWRKIAAQDPSFGHPEKFYGNPEGFVPTMPLVGASGITGDAEIGMTDDFTWSRWFFPCLTTDAGLKEIDRYFQEYIRYTVTGRHYKGNYRIRYEMLKEWGYESLVNAYYHKKINEKH